MSRDHPSLREGLHGIGQSTTPLPTVGSVAAPAYKYSQNFCDDQTEIHHENEGPPSFDLEPGCFSRFVFIPNRWNKPRVQCKGHDESAWEVWAEPRGPLTYKQLMMSPQTGSAPLRHASFEPNTPGALAPPIGERTVRTRF